MKGPEGDALDSFTVSQISDENKMRSNSGFPVQNDEEELIYDFQAFVTQLRDPRADPVLRYTRSFLNNFTTKRDMWTCEEQQKLVDDFKVFVYDKLTLYEPFKSLDSAKLKNAQEGIEKLIMGKLYNQCFSPCVEQRFQGKIDPSHHQDLKRDEKLRLRREEYAFIDPGLLEIPNSLTHRLHKFTRLSGKELSRINEYKAPRDKMVCVLNACRVLFGFLKHSGLENGGADAFIPVLVYTVLKSDVRSLISNLNYIERFRYSEFLHGESAYYLSSTQGAADFVANLGRESLHITDEAAFQAQYAKHQEYVKNERAGASGNADASAAKTNTVATSTPAPASTPAPSEYIRRPLDEATSAILSKVSELFASTTQASEAPDEQSDSKTQLPQPDEDADTTALAQELQEQENHRVLEELHVMFPDMDQELIQDVCEAKKYRIGVCVDVLLTLSS
ncbi:LAME_0G20010g1_1 [Lachancea meyersii CBS 8951]|uniref:LAME_0G20010g1_1 n=1 Tax=Lachancea meyersii CBS 8951 TaxID=1266667 RepID=A0A1G4KCD1_9SACH|nr:LAME_0G20010g1_1 [Lachancea meyersii CBS 8951]